MNKNFSNIFWKGPGKTLATIFVSALLGGSAAAAEVRVTRTETFEAGTNQGGWTWGSNSGYFVDANGNPGRYFRDSRLVTFTPRASTSFGLESVFTGDYKARNVESVGIDMAIASVSNSVSGRTVTLILLNDNGTPADLTDDWGAYTLTNFPVPPTGVAGIVGSEDVLQWVTYDIPVPSQSVSLPDGWSWLSRGYVRRNGSWTRLMRDVNHVGFILGDPAVLYPLFAWDVALDNPRITTIEQQ